MPLWVPSRGHYDWNDNLTVSARLGNTITASGTPHTKGSYSSLKDPTPEGFGVWLRCRNVGLAATDTSMLLDLAVEDTGGGNPRILVNNFDCGMAGTANDDMGVNAFLPMYIPEGCRLSARAQAVIGSDQVQVSAFIETRPLYPTWSTRCVTYGADAANSRGTSVTTATDTFGSWTQITASTSEDHRYFLVGYDQLGDTTVASSQVLIELGVGAAASERGIDRFIFSQGNGEEISGPWPPIPIYAPVPAGSRLAVRIASAEAEARGIIVYAFN